MCSRKRRLCVLAFLVEELFDDDEEKKRTRGKTREWLKTREKSLLDDILAELLLEDPASDRNWLRMDQYTLKHLVELVKPYLQKQTTVLRIPISVEERLAITIRFLATGDTLREIGRIFRVGDTTVSLVVFETCNVLIEVLRYTFAFPSNTEEWKEIAKDYNSHWNIPHCLGAISEKHIFTRKPIKYGSQFKETASFTLMGVVDSNLIFRYADVITKGTLNEEGIWQNCGLSHLLEEDKLKIPPKEKVEGTSMSLPYIFVADEAFPLTKYLLKPYTGDNLSREQQVFNYRLQYAQRCANNAFGILASRFRILLKPITVAPEKVTKLVMAILSLHNYLRLHTGDVYSPLTMMDREYPETDENCSGGWRKDIECSFHEVQALPSHYTPSTEAKDVQNLFCQYFNIFNSEPNAIS